MKSFLTISAIILLALPVIAQNQERLSVHYMDIKPREYQEFLEHHNKKNEILENFNIEEKKEKPFNKPPIKNM